MDRETTLRIETHHRDGYLHAIVSGEFTLQGAQQAFLAVLDVVAERRSEKVLFDCRLLTGDVQRQERFFFGDFAGKAAAEFYKRRLTNRATAFAFVLPTAILDPKRFGETVATNRGMITMACDNLAEALRWLGIEEPAHND